MNNNRKFYIEKIALDARNRLIEEKIIDPDQKALRENQLEQIVAFYGGTLVFDNPQKTFMEKTDDNSYVIHYGKAFNYLHIIHELGHAFLNLDQMKIGGICYFDGSEETDSEASLFARAFLMPRSTFEQVVIDHLNDGKFSIQNVAKEYGIDYLEVLARGEELNIGN